MLYCCRRILDGKRNGVTISDIATKGRLEGCEISGNVKAGVQIEEADPLLASCK